jgi:hypothetical protein
MPAEKTRTGARNVAPRIGWWYCRWPRRLAAAHRARFAQLALRLNAALFLRGERPSPLADPQFGFFPSPSVD